MRLSGPLSVLVEVISLCQLRCRYCSAAPFNGTQMPRERALEIIKELGSFPVWAITFSGGEPLLHPHIYDFIRASFATGIRPTVNTNGLKLLEQSTLDSLLKLKNEGVEYTLSVSLDSPVCADNDVARRRGEEVIRAINDACKAGLDVTISAVVHLQNLKTALDIPARFPEVRQFRYSPVVTRHLEESVAAQLQVEDSAMNRFWLEAAALQKRLGEACILLPMREAGDDAGEAIVQKEHKTCYCGFTSCVIDSQLNVYPCDWARSPLMKMGNLGQDTLRSVWSGADAERIRDLAKTSRLCLMKAGAASSACSEKSEATV